MVGQFTEIFILDLENIFYPAQTGNRLANWRILEPDLAGVV